MQHIDVAMVTSKAATLLTTARAKQPLTGKIITSLVPSISASTSLKNIVVIVLFATGVIMPKSHLSGGDGTQEDTSGTDGGMEDGITGAHPREDSLDMDGPGIRATGITTVMSGDTLVENGGDSKAEDGSSMVAESQLVQRNQEATNTSADHSTSSPRRELQLLWVSGEFHVAELEDLFTCILTMQVASSLEERKFTRNIIFAEVEAHTPGKECQDASSSSPMLSPKRA